MIIVSACLAGINCRHDGGNCVDWEVVELCMAGLAAPVCPEMLAGLPTPRPAAGIESGDGRSVLRGKARVRNRVGADLTGLFIAGAKKGTKIARLIGCKEAWLREKSPSCGVSSIYRNGILTRGMGVFAAALLGEKLKLRGIDGR